MARSYEQVLEDTISNQAKQICSLVSQNEVLVETNAKLGSELIKAQNALSNYSKFNLVESTSNQDIQPDSRT